MPDLVMPDPLIPDPVMPLTNAMPLGGPLADGGVSHTHTLTKRVATELATEAGGDCRALLPVFRW